MAKIRVSSLPSWRAVIAVVSCAGVCLLLWAGLRNSKVLAGSRHTGTVPNLDWPNYGNDLGMQRYQNIDQINPGNASDLHVAWVFHTGVLDEHGTLQGTPIIVNGTMYVTDGHDDVFALNAATGQKLWDYKPVQMHDMVSLHELPLCCGRNNRGVAVGNGLVYLARLDNAVVALNQSTGAVVWKNVVEDYGNGYSMTSAPQFVATAGHPNGIVIVAPAGGEFLARGEVFALSATTGAVLWRTYTTAGPTGWGGDDYLHGGAMVWNVPAIDTALNQVVFGTGNAGRDVLGQFRPGTNPYTASLMALDLDTGAIKWTFQEVHHDIWDYDAAQSVSLFNVVQGNVTTPAVGHCGKTGQFYILNRATGVPIFPVVEVPVPTMPAFQQPWPTQPYSSVDPATPQTFVRPNDSGLPTAPTFTPPDRRTTLQVLGGQGGCEWPPTAYSPRTHYVYYAGRYEPGGYHSAPFNEGEAPVPGQEPVSTVGSKFSPHNLPVDGTHPFGLFGAMNVDTGKVAFQIHVRQPATSGIAVGGDVMFYGETNGKFHAADARTGDVLFTFDAPDHIDNAGGAAASPAVYAVNGREFVVYEFGGNVIDQANQPPSPVGDAIIAFSLGRGGDRRRD